jgi:hypothetical protein
MSGTRYTKHVWSAEELAEADDETPAEEIDRKLKSHANRLRDTADQLARGEDEKAGGLRRWHAIARLRKMADEIAPDTREMRDAKETK